jgi:hypothetical protein
VHPPSLPPPLSLTPFPSFVSNNHSFFEERLLFYRERSAGLYSSFPYWLSFSVPYVPQCIAGSVAYASLVYHMTGLRDGLGAWAGPNSTALIP